MKRHLSSTLSIGVFALAATLLNPEQAFACRTPVGDFVWLDINANGLQNAGEPGINGVTVKITPDHLTPFGRTAVTANKPGTSDAGYYSFVVECDTAHVISVDAATVPAMYGKSPIGVGSDVAIDSNDHDGTPVYLAMPAPGVAPPPDLTFDFGYTPACSGVIGDLVWNDLNNNGIQDSGEPPVAGAIVTLNSASPVATSALGKYSYGGLCKGTYTICAQVPPGSTPSPADQGADDAIDSDGVIDGHGNSCKVVTLPYSNTVDLTNDFGLWYPPVVPTGAGTPGYWRNHPQAWPVQAVTVGGATFTKDQAIAWIDMSDGDKTVTLFRALVSAMLNVAAGTDASCISSTIASAQSWFSSYGPVGSNVKASSLAWRLGEPIYRTLDNYNNGMLCAPSRDTLQ